MADAGTAGGDSQGPTADGVPALSQARQQQAGTAMGQQLQALEAGGFQLTAVVAARDGQVGELWAQVLDYLRRSHFRVLGVFRSVRSIDRSVLEAATSVVTCKGAESSLQVHPDEEASEPKDSAGDDQCTICLEDFQAGEELRVLPCKHRYHRSCVDCWLLQARRPECP
eukprot:CAMPEP_0180515652 /NCGR_PEP_ID=MMETSP1036_2-20121128/53443_1 /TAXON_ID=632150 /ORGANISM="Azadinium spinosum, Strain 3D9" /LENGTH=168 /DNA_ID=CAMNT_0022527287 /DNA_START=37 /DNA_END=539 /DNA_ORIENTATION=+